MARGRRPSGPRLVEGCMGSPEAKERASVILETIAGLCTIREACRRLEVSQAHFHRLRERLLESAIDSQEPRPPGRPAHPAGEDPRLIELRQHCEELERANHISRVREEILSVMPHLLVTNTQKKRHGVPR